MKPQNYSNHVRYYFPHHFIFYPIAITAMGVSIWCSFHEPQNAAIWTAISFIFLLIISLSFMLRQHYALMNQNRIVRLELRLRYYIATQQRFEVIESRLSQGQLFALRFASDEEFLPLIERTIKENISADEIKQSIKNWMPDHMRV